MALDERVVSSVDDPEPADADLVDDLVLAELFHACADRSTR
jgi:hypothetical protein